MAAPSELASAGSAAILYRGLSALPFFNPDVDHEPAPVGVAERRGQISHADAAVFSTPEYAGMLPGSLKHLLDWTVGSGFVSGKPVVWIIVAAPGRGLGALATLATVLGSIDVRILDEAYIDLPIARDMVQPRAVATVPERDALARWWATMRGRLETSE